MPSTASPTWDPDQYLRHSGHRARPFRDLLAQVPALPTAPAPRITDLGCGPGNVTLLLAERWPEAHITGYDNSPEMLRQAQALAGPTAGGGRLEFAGADAGAWAPGPGTYDLILSNATLQWVPGHVDRFPDWVAALRPGGVLAVQMPANFDAPSHALMRELCGSSRWRGRLDGVLRHADAVLEPTAYLELLTGLGCAADVWSTTYQHLLTGADPVLDWVKGTGLRPVLTALADDPEARDAFLGEYRDLLRVAYPAGAHGTVFPFRRLFAVARKGGAA
ncbi:trans-aconitate 2-methyltransferase [Streptomyces flavofungini]|uniref:Trans-aconitate 2-methyltransferase n=1 Tax=Streptomyces flavofungini TaxID=68200 RepID=A0ABS0X080_9ACTN|nr:trans-aconitate 2-methyltransferase [Streptomyces flavofungini]MBJ3806571.1 trans-aconitate 2-methyltransferase [Streptomyces flavofungini]GHC61975.1 trans-aconitate 2-methyltransferase [Streptomyces flavofungini]